MWSDTITLRQAFLNNRRERLHLGSPALRIVGFETRQQRLEHRVELLGRLVPTDDGIAEPHQTL